MENSPHFPQLNLKPQPQFCKSSSLEFIFFRNGTSEVAVARGSLVPDAADRRIRLLRGRRPHPRVHPHLDRKMFRQNVFYKTKVENGLKTF